VGLVLRAARQRLRADALPDPPQRRHCGSGVVGIADHERGRGHSSPPRRHADHAGGNVALAAQRRDVSDGMAGGGAEVRHRPGAAAAAARSGAGDAQLNAHHVLGGGGGRQRTLGQRRRARRGVRGDDGIRSRLQGSMTLLLYLIIAIALLRLMRVPRRAAIVLILLPFPFVGFALLTNRVYGGHGMIFLSQPWADYASKLPWNWYLLDQALALAPWQHAVRQSLAHHQWPLWNPGMNSGDILAAGMQVAPYNPLNLIALLLPEAWAPTFCAAMTFFLAGLFTYAFAREIECSEGASLVAAMGFAYSGAVTFWVGWTPLSSWILLPLVLLAIRRASLPLLIVAFTLLILFGHPETMLHVVVIGGAYALVERGRAA